MHRQGVLLNAVMLTSLAAVVSGAVVRFMPTWQPLFPLTAVAIIALEAGVIHWTYRRDRMWTGELLRYLAPEILVMVAMMRVVTSLSMGASLLAEAQRWLRDPLSVIDAPFLLMVLVGFMIGATTHRTMQALRDLEPQEFEQASSEDDANRIMQIVAQDRAESLRSISSRFIIGGGLVMLALALESVNVQRIYGPGNATSPTSVVGALAYLISGFLLYSQARLALLKTRWRLDGAVVSPLVAKRWGRASWLIIAGVALFSAVLPRTYGLGLLDTLRGALGVVGYVFALLGYAVIWLFSLIALIPALLMAMLAGQPGPAQPWTMPAPPMPPQEPPPAAGDPNLVSAILFWLCMLMLVGYALFTIAQRHPLLVEKVMMRGPLRKIWAWLREFWRDTRGWATLAVASVRERLQRPLSSPALRGPMLRLGSLAPRELVRYFYRSTLRRAARGGVRRGVGQTPNEYRAGLARSLPEAEPDIAALTESFVAAQYSPRDIDSAEASKARAPWQRLRGKLRALSQPQTPNDDRPASR